MKINIRPGELNNLLEIQELFSQTISFVCAKDYDTNQLEAWKSSIQNTKRWYDLIEKQYFIVAEFNHKIVGFASLENGNYIDVLFVHKDFQRKGIAQQLFDDLEQNTRIINGLLLTSDVSKTAQAFFKHNGFETLAEQTQKINGIEIINYKMRKVLSYE